MIVASITNKNSNINSFYCYENQKDPANTDKMDLFQNFKEQGYQNYEIKNAGIKIQILIKQED